MVEIKRTCRMPASNDPLIAAPGRPAQGLKAQSRNRSKRIYHDAWLKLKNDPAIAHSLRRLKGRPEASSALSILSLLARRGTNLKDLRRVAEQISDFKSGPQAARAMDVLSRAVVRDRQATIVLSTLLLRNPGLLRARAETLILFGRIYPDMEDPDIVESLSPGQVEDLAAAFRSTLSAFPVATGAFRAHIEEIFFTVLNRKLREAEIPARKMDVITKWPGKVISILNATDSRFAE
jgi:hypothetical protein